MNKIKLGLVSCGYLGCSPVAPGTFGTLGGVAIAWGLSFTGHYLAWSLATCVILYGIGRALGPWAESYAGKKDPGIFVLDEVIGYLLTVAWTASPSPLALCVAFFVFRFFDIWKPAPASHMEKIPGGDGILLDDVVAGLMGFALVMLPARLLLDLPWSLGGSL